ncbi:MAG: hypothetical protein AB8B53_04725 [Flavobacteriales bacterium]
MKLYTRILIISLFSVAMIGLQSCQSSKYGDKVKEPFSTGKYESNNRWFRSTGKGVSKKDNIAKSKADLAAKSELAGQVETNMKQVADLYLDETGMGNNSELTEKFSSLTRQVMNTTIVDLRKIGEEKFFNAEEDVYTVFMADEIKKAAMFRFMKKQIKVDKKLSKVEIDIMEAMLDAEIKKLEAEEDND